MKNFNKLFVILFFSAFAIISCGGSSGDGGGAGDGSPVSLTELEDVEGNKYSITLIGDQLWMAENLRTISFRDGSWMLTGLIDDDWPDAGPASCIYPHDYIDGLDSDAEVVEAYGRLYNWNAVSDTRGLCPEGWRVPTEEDWLELIEYLGGEDVAGGKLKSKRTDPDTHPRWDSPNTGATDGYHFSALPGGFRSCFAGWYDYAGYCGEWWNTTELDSLHAGASVIYSDEESIIQTYRNKKTGLSVRCICNYSGQ